MLNLDRLLEKAKWESLTDREISLVVKRIQERQNDDDLYTLLHILGRSEADQYRALVEKFLYYPKNPMVSDIALTTLCNYWELTEEYLDTLKEFMIGVDWDEDEDVRLGAISCAGQFLKHKVEKQLLIILINIFENDDDDICREAAFRALGYAIGMESKEIRAPKSEDKINSIIEKARQMINTAA